MTLTADERGELEDNAKSANPVINALILLNCDEGAFNDHRSRGRMTNICGSARKVDRAKKRFVEEGLDAALGRQQGQRVYERKADGELEAHLVPMRCGEPPEGFARWSLLLLADRAGELEYVDSISYETVRRVLKKTKSSRGGRLAG